MPVINLEIDEDVFIPKFYPYLFDYSHRWEFWMGSAGSGKSYFITQKLLLRALQEPIRIMVCRKTATTLRQTCFSLFKRLISDWNLLPLAKINESDFRIRFVNGSEIFFTGLDEETKLLSLDNIGSIFIEEAFEVPQSIVNQLNLRMRGNNPNQQIIMAWNPISQDSWLYDFTVTNPPKNSVFIHSTFVDNPFLDDDNRDAILDYKTRNPNLWRIFGLGEWGIIEEGLVFKNWRIEDFDINDISRLGYNRRAGSDLGFVDPTTIVDSWFDKSNHRIYVTGLFYRNGCQLDEVAEEMNKLIGKHTKCYMDSAEPRSIEFFRLKGYNTYACLKGQNSVQARIRFLQNHEIVVHPSCEDLIRELSNFSYIKDPKTDKYTEKTTHEYSHAIDALGYAYSDIYMNKQLKTFDKKLLGL